MEVTPDCMGIGPDAGTSGRHRHPSEGHLIAPDGTKVPGGFMCREHARVVIDEYKTKLGETWAFQEWA